MLPRLLAPDVVVMDYHLDDGTGRDATLAMREAFPSARFVFLSRDDSDDARLAAVEAGASAYIHKSSPGSELIAAIRKVAQGASLISPAMVARLVSRGRDREHMRDSLSPREREVLQLMADGVGTRRSRTGSGSATRPCAPTYGRSAPSWGRGPWSTP